LIDNRAKPCEAHILPEGCAGRIFACRLALHALFCHYLMAAHPELHAAVCWMQLSIQAWQGAKAFHPAVSGMTIASIAAS